MNNNGMWRHLALVVFLTLLLSGLYEFVSGNGVARGSSAKMSFSEFLNKVENGEVANISIRGNSIEGNLTNSERFTTYAPNYPGLVDKLKDNNVIIDVLPLDNKVSSILGIIISWLPLAFLLGILMYFIKQVQSGGTKALGFGKSKAKMVESKDNKTSFKDVAGIEEAKADLAEIVEFLKHPTKFRDIGARIPKGCLLVGAPGTGKTLLARALAGEAGVPFFTASGSDFVEMFVGVGAGRVRDLFAQAKEKAPSVVFIDEIDAVGKSRNNNGFGGSNDEREQTLNQLLVEMDGFEENTAVVVIAATNRADVLDNALLRPGRFDRKIVIPMPDLKGREEILNVHMNKIRYAPDVSSTEIARATIGFSGADLANLVNEAALLAARHDKKMVTSHDFEEARDKILMGSERKTQVDKEELELTAYHEAGHAIVAFYLSDKDENVYIHKATIVPRGEALGMVMRLPYKDRRFITRAKLNADLAVAMGGRVAEEIIFGHDKVTSGASSDIKQATRIAYAMVSEWGMSDKVGPLFHGNENNYFRQDAKTAQDIANLIDKEAKSLVDFAYDNAKTILTKHLDQLHALANALLTHETLTGDEIKDVLSGKELANKKRDKIEEIKIAIRSSVPTSEDFGTA